MMDHISYSIWLDGKGKLGVKEVTTNIKKKLSTITEDSIHDEKNEYFNVCWMNTVNLCLVYNLMAGCVLLGHS